MNSATHQDTGTDREAVCSARNARDRPRNQQWGPRRITREQSSADPAVRDGKFSTAARHR